MAFGWHFIDLSDSQKAQRRVALDTAANVAQYSALVPLLCLQLYFLFLILDNRRSSHVNRFISPSLYLNNLASDKPKWSYQVRKTVTSLTWWASTPVGKDWGSRGEWLFGAIWAAWLLLLSIAYTGEDYFHVTRRFGIVAASQLPLHYLLALRAPYSPLQILTRLSHEQLNRGHQVLGRIITIFFYAHGFLYLNYFIQARSLIDHLRGRVVLLGLLSLISFTIIGTTALSVLRTWNYRVFYITHITLAALLLPFLFFHVHHIRIYIWECLLIYLMQAITRYACTRTYRGRISLLPHTTLLKIDISLPQNAGIWRPGDHVYLTLPFQRGMKTPTDALRHVLAALRGNPFTVASVPAHDGQVTLVARVRRGTTKQLAAQASDSVAKVRLEGPYGAARYLPDLFAFARVLLIAGGVGGTFAVPIFQSLLRQLQATAAGPELERQKLRLLWLGRDEADAAWAVRGDERERLGWERNAEIVGTGDRKALGGEETAVDQSGRRGKKDDVVSGGDEDIELAEREGLLDEDNVEEESGEDVAKNRSYQHIRGGRERLLEYVDELFAGDIGETVAVLVCGPQTMARSVRAELRRHAQRGRQVFFHAEEFGL